MKATLLLADSAQAVDGKLYILGGGWTFTGPTPSTFAVAGLIEVDWDRTNDRHRLRLSLVDQDGQPVMIPTPTGDRPLEISGDFEVGRPPGHPRGTPITIPIAFNLGPVQLPPGRRLVWRLSVSDNPDEITELAFNTRAAQPATNPPA